MKTRFWAILVLLCLSAPAFADEGEPVPFRKRFSLELGAGNGPFHMLIRNVSPSWERQEALGQEGLEADLYDVLYPAFSLSGVYRYHPRWESVVTAGISWSHHKVTRYEEFGVDPQGQPRYDLQKGHPAGWRDSTPVGSLTFQWRVFWNPAWTVQFYSGFGLGFTTVSSVYPLPAIMPVGLRYGGNHFYFFAEAPVNPVALFFHGGVGYRF